MLLVGLLGQLLQEFRLGLVRRLGLVLLSTLEILVVLMGLLVLLVLQHQ